MSVVFQIVRDTTSVALGVAGTLWASAMVNHLQKALVGQSLTTVIERLPVTICCYVTGICCSSMLQQMHVKP